MCISGYKLDKCNGALAGWNITLTNGSYTKSALTDAAGKYEFCDLAAGDYELTEELQDGWVPVSAPGTVTLVCGNATYQNFTNQKLLCISGFKKDDCTGEGIGGWLINLNNSSYATSVQTGSDGKYEFCRLLPGDYTLTEETASGYTSTSAVRLSVTLPCEGNLTNINFTNQKLLCISGFKKDACTGEGIGGWLITLNNSSYTTSVQTGSDGKYEFCRLLPGDYTLTEETASGYTSTSAVRLSVTLPCEGNLTNINFTNQKLLCISGFKKDACTGEGIGGWLITLNNSSYTTSVQTGSDGKYEFCRLVPGDYTLTEETASGYTSTSAVRLSVTLPCEGNLTNINFTNQKLLCINGTKTDGSGRPLPGWNITLTNGSYTKSVLTDGTGKYEFCGLWPDQYRVCEELKDGWINITDKCRDVMLECKDEVVYFKNIPASLLCISGTKINSCTGEGLVGWTIDLKNSTDTVINTTLTDEKGNYSFCGLRPGSYTVCEKLLSGWKNVSPSCVDVELGCAGSEGNDFRNTNTPLLCISGYKLDDRNKTGLEGWEIVLTNATGEVARNTTNAIGYYQFRDLEPGDYDLRETPKAGYVSVEIPGTVKLECKNLTDQNFTNRKTDGKIWTVCKNGSCDFTIIQDAINAASPGDTIEVQSGTYYEHVVVNKTLILKGVDTGSGLPVVDGEGSGGAITLSADGCSLQGFNACNPSLHNSGIMVISDKNTITGNIATGNSLSSPSNNAISGSPFNYKYGIYLKSSRDNNISGNTATGNDYGICLESSRDNIISRNIATGNDYGIHLTSSSSGNTISGNTATGKTWGIYLFSSSNNSITGNTATGNKRGIHLSSSTNNTISDNEATGNDVGIYLYSSSGNTISGNTATGNAYGIYLISSSSRNNISGNTITGNNGYGIDLTSSSSNIIFLNYMNNNTKNACSNGINRWHSTEINSTHKNYTGNYWSDYQGTDSNRDGIGDQPYDKISSSESEKDDYPIMSNGRGLGSLGPAIQISLDGSLQLSRTASYAQLLKVTNLGDSEIRDINITNQLSPGIAGISVESGSEPDISLEPDGTHILKWQDAGPLGPGEGREIGLLALLDDPLPETLISLASVQAISADGRNLSDEASLELNAGANISIEKEADPAFAQASDPVSFSINVSNTGQMNLTSVRVNDTLPQSMSYVSDDSNGSLSGHLVSWDLGLIEPGGLMPIILTARVNEDASGLQINEARVTATTENGSQIFASDIAEVDILSLNVSKEADRKTVKRGENITYTITICNDGSLPLEDVVAWDVVDKQLILLYSSMDTGEDGKWHLGTLAPGQCAVITLIVQVPERNFRFDMTSSVSGDGFVNVADDYSTTLPQLVIKNTVYALTSSIKGQSEDTATVTVLGEAGTELSNREHGSGIYESEEELRIITENKSIQANRSMTAMHQPVTLSLYGSRTVNASSPWSERTLARNRVSGLSFAGSLTHAKNISLDSRIKLDENESVLELSSEFEGQGQFGAKKKSQDGKKTFLDSQDDYAGSFKVYQKIDEYGSGLSSRRSASGTGFVAGDRRVGTSQRSHEAGTGNYSAEEMIETYTNFIHKDVNLSSSPVDLSRTVPRWLNQSSKWTEGIYSRDQGRTLLEEEYSSLTQMDKETLLAGLNYIQSQANFTGRASYRQAVEGKMDLEQEYLGRYSIKYKTSLQGTARFDRPHINVIKDGQIIKPENQSRTYARYKIMVENDGNEILSPIYVSDLFPPGAVYVNSSLRPSLTQSSANWSLTHLPVGERSEITLWLEIGENLSNRLVNRVQVAGSHEAGWASASNLSVLECGWLPCAPSRGDQIAVKKSAFVNESASDLVWYLLRIENQGNCTSSLTVTDSLPRGMRLIEATPDVTSYDLESNTLFWNIISLKPKGSLSIIYQVQVTGGGRQVNQVKVEAISPEGCDMKPAYDSTVLVLGKESEESWPDDWKPPENWEFQCFDTSCV